MANWREGSGKPKPTGKGGKTPSPGANPPSDAADWRGKKTAPRESSARSGKTYLNEETRKGPRNVGILNLLLLVLVILVGSFIAIIGCQPTKTPMLHLAVLEHDDALWEPNAYAAEDRENFVLSMGKTGNIELITGRSTAAGSDNEKPWLNLSDTEFPAAITNYLDVANGPGGPRPGGWIFYLSCHGVTNYDGVPYLVAKNSRSLSPHKPLDSGKLVSLESILRAIAEHTKVKQYPKAYKLLVLDAGRMESQWSTSRLFNDFPSAVKRLADNLPQDIQLANTHLLLSNDDGQKSWTNWYEGGTNFGLTFGRGLMGEANETQDARNDDSISLGELDRYLKTNVDAWAQQHRNSRQAPVLITIGPEGSPDNILLTRVGDAKFETKPRGNSPLVATPASSKTSSGGENQDQRLAELWAALDFLGNAGALRLAPVRFNLIEYDLIQAESLADAGSAYQRTMANVCSQHIVPALDDLAKTLARYDGRAAQLIATSNLPFFRQSGIQKGVGEGVSFPIGSLAQWKLIHAGPSPEIPGLEQLRTNRDQINKEKQTPDLPAEKQTAPLKCADYYAAAESLLDDFTQQREIVPKNIELVLAYLKTAPNSPVSPESDGTHVVEVEFLAMLGDFLNTLETNFALQADAYDAIDIRNTMVLALRCRRRLERIVAMEDKRVAPWLQHEIDEADRVRREAEDRLFALQAKQAHDLLQPLLESPQGIEAIETRKGRLEEAYRVADSVRKSAPFLLEWLTHHPYPADVRQQRLGQLTLAIERCHKLVDQLTPPQVEGEDRPDYARAAVPDETLVSEIARNYSDVVGFLNRQSQEIIQAQGGKDRSDSETLLEIHNLLRVRYVARLTASMSTYDRNSLRAKKRAIQGQSLGIANVALSEVSPLILGVASLQKTPWQLMLRQASGSADYKVEPLSEKRLPLAEQLLQSSHETVTLALSAFDQAFKSSTTLDRRIPPFGTASNTAAAYAFTGVVVDNRSQVDGNRSTPCLAIYREHRKDHLAWLGHRVLNDFWGNESNHPYFERQTQHYLAAFNSETIAAPSDLAEAINSRFNQLRKDYRQWVNVGSPAESISESTDVLDHQLTIHFPPSIPSGISAIDVLIDENTAIPVANSAGERKPTHPFETQPAGLYQEQRKFLQRIDVTSVAKATSSMERIRFRGHAKRFPLEISGTQQPDSIQQLVDINPFPFRQPTITVSGEMAGSADVIFILDCSGSMANPLQGVRQGTRMSAAKSVLNDLLNSMASAQGKYRILTMAFGSQAGWPQGNSPQPILRPGVDVPAGIVPGNDVKTLGESQLAPLLNRDPGRNEPGINVNRLTAEVNDLGAFGETPLYYSIRMALQKVDPAKATQLIVITDGVNTQTATSTDAFRTSASQLVDEISQAKYRNLQLQVIGFALGAEAQNLQLNKDRPPREDTLEQLAWIARFKGNGGFIPADQPLEMRRRIEELIQTKVYFSVREKDDPKDPTPYDFGAIWYASNNFGGNRRRYEVRELQTNDTANVELRGGEALKLSYDNVLKQMTFDEDRAVDAARETISVVDSVNGAGTYLARVLNFQTPDTDTGTLEMPIRLENTNNTLFTVRPFHLWAEIQPSVTNAFAENELFETRYYGDLLLRNETQFPEFLLKLNQWQPAARWARVKLYLQLEKRITPEKSISLRDLLVKNVTDSGADFAAGKFRVESSTSLGEYPFQVVVRVEPGNQGILPHQVEITPAPPRIQRTYNLAGDGSRKILSITHRFFYESKSDVEADTNPRVDIWTREQLTTGVPSFTVDVQIPR